MLTLKVTAGAEPGSSNIEVQLDGEYEMVVCYIYQSGRPYVPYNAWTYEDMESFT